MKVSSRSTTWSPVGGRVSSDARFRGFPNPHDSGTTEDGGTCPNPSSRGSFPFTGNATLLSNIQNSTHATFQGSPLGRLTRPHNDSFLGEK